MYHIVHATLTRLYSILYSRYVHRYSSTLLYTYVCIITNRHTPPHAHLCHVCNSPPTFPICSWYIYIYIYTKQYRALYSVVYLYIAKKKTFFGYDSSKKEKGIEKPSGQKMWRGRKEWWKYRNGAGRGEARRGGGGTLHNTKDIWVVIEATPPSPFWN